MDLITILVSILRAGWPLPDFKSEVSFLEWWNRLGPVAFQLIGRITPATCEAMTEDAIVAAVQAEVPEANGEKIKALLAFLMQVLPYLLPLLLKPAPQPAPLTT